MKQSKRNIQQQWNRLLELPSAYSRLTVELYETLHQRCNMMAHFNREGFFKSRFWTLSDFDQTLSSMSSSAIGRELLKNTPELAIEKARYKIASIEAHGLRLQSANCLDLAMKLQSKFQLEL